MNIPASTVARFSRQFLKVKKNSPTIFFAAGVAGMVTSTVMACRATLKLSETMDEIQRDIDKVKAMDPVQVITPATNHETSTEAAVVNNTKTIYIYTHSGLKLVKLYAPAALIGIGSVGLLTGSHLQLMRRNAALMAAYAAVQKAYEDYRDRVREQIGESKELDIYHAAKTETVKDSDGKDVKVKVADPNRYSPYARFFDEYSTCWERDAERNRVFIQVQQNFFNHRLIAYGHVFLNEVYDHLGLERSRAGSVVGWLKDGDGDGYIDFGLFEAYNSKFVNATEQSILLDFNVDGVIYDKI